MTVTTTNYGLRLPTPNDPGSANTWGTTLNNGAFTPIDNYLLKTATSNISPTAPTVPTTTAGQAWINTTIADAWTVNIYSGSTGGWVTTGTINPTVNPATYAPAGPGARMPNVQIFTTSGTYTQTSGCLYVVAEVLGSGAGGGGALGNSGKASCGGSGGAGGYAKLICSAATIGATQAITIGSGGTAGAAGVAGGAGATSSIGSLVSATGGVGGIAGNIVETYGLVVIAPSAGGTGVGGTINVVGGASTMGVMLNTSCAGTGGSSVYGTGGVGVFVFSGSGSVGNPGSSVGAGGSGGIQIANSSGFIGGAGGAGIVIITEYFG